MREHGALMMRFLFLRAYWKLIVFDLYLARDDFAGLYGKVRDSSARRTHCRGEVVRICSAVDLACIWYRKEVLCLQRSAAATCLLKEHGIAAELVIGAQQMPFRAHAWVEVNGQVVNDKPYTPDMYQVLDRC
jgi:hypothetical protein